MADAPPDYSVRYAPNQEPSSGYGYNTNPQYGQPTAAPQQTQNVNVVVNQPAGKQVKFVDPRKYPLPRDWNSGLCECSDDMVDCCLTFFCTSCKLGCAARDMNESSSITCFTPAPLLIMRTKVRIMYGIQGGICGDCVTTTFCPYCAQCQIQRQLKTPCQVP